MDKTSTFSIKKSLTIVLFFFLGISHWNTIYSFSNLSTLSIQDSINYTEYKGRVIDAESRKPLTAALIAINETNISTISNDEGRFLLKIPKNSSYDKITVSYLGFKNEIISFSELDPLEENVIKLNVSITELSEVNIDPTDPNALIRAVIKNKEINYPNDHTIMTAFYRETIKKRRSYVSLSEAVLDIYKTPYSSDKTDIIKLHKARKSADYRKLDTLTIKLQGGPSSTLHIDIMKNSDILFYEGVFRDYEFTFDQSTKINNRYVHVLSFKQRSSIKDPLYFGKIYIDAQNMAVTKAIFSLNLQDQEKASKMFVRKKPRNAKVYPTKVTYTIDYRQKNGKWFYSYGQIDLVFKINWKRKLFNTIYKLNVEMAVTDWKQNTEKESLRTREQLKSTVIISDKASGFSDPEFWGEYNIIEPEKPIESAIQKIQKQLKNLR